MARPLRLRSRSCVAAGSRVWRENLVTDTPFPGPDEWQIADPVVMERDLNEIAGVVTVRKVFISASLC